MTSRIPISSRRHIAAAALLTAAVLTGTACTSGQASPGATPSSGSPATSSSASPTPTPTPTPTASYKPADASGRAQNVPVPVLPEAAKAETKEGAIAFAKHWYTLLSYAYVTGDLGPMDAVTGATCGLCQKVRPGIQEWNLDGRWIAGGLVTAEVAV